MKPTDRALSRREFARRTALGAAAVASDPSRALDAFRVSERHTDGSAQQVAEASKLSPQSQAEVEARYQAILAQYPDRFSDVQKADLRHVCAVTQQALDGLRAYSISNGDQPALYLKPLVEREKRTNAPPNLKSATVPAAKAPATAGKPAGDKPAKATTPEKP